MRSSTQRVLAAILTLLIAPIAANAQFGPPIGSYSPPKTNPNPTVSPYLNLTRPGIPGVNYYGMVRPQIENSRAIQNLEFGMGGMGGGLVGPDGNPIPGAQQYYPNQAQGLQTGHPATYFYYSHYYQFPNVRGGGGGGGAGGVNNSNFGRPSNSQSVPFYAGSGGLIFPVNPAGSNPIGLQPSTGIR